MMASTCSASFVAGFLAYSLATFAGGYIWHLYTFQEAYLSLEVWSKMDDPVIALGASAIGLQGLLLSYMLPRYQIATASSGPVGGAKFGLWVGVFMFSVAVLAHSAKNKMACVEGFVALEGGYCLLQFPLSLAFAAFAQQRASRRSRAPSSTPAKTS